MDLPFLLPQTRIFRAYGLTPDLKMRYVAYICLVSAIFSFNVIVGSFSIYHHLSPHRHIYQKMYFFLIFKEFYSVFMGLI